MHPIEQEAPSVAFERAWLAAAQYLEARGEQNVDWLRSTLHLPMAEHLSFRMGNQIFFIFIEAAEFKYAKWRDLFLSACKKANATPCLMPMTEQLGLFKPRHTGWGLVHAETGLAINPVAMVSDEKIEMSDWELHSFAIQVVSHYLNDDGKKITSVQSSLDINPSIWFADGGLRHWVVVRAARHPQQEALPPNNMQELNLNFAAHSDGGYFASVVVCSADDPFDPEAAQNGNFLPLYRGHGMTVRYAGLQEIV